ncbi:MAG: ATP-binding cassette domain-containing protein [Actinobacteria bacterium]|nr:ATP-binding cassette domain-containing protein [Actinomycetota bacterium]
MSEKKYAIEIENLCFNYPDGTPALDKIDLKVSEGETLGILGANGAGKSTLVLHLNGILTGSGRITIMGLEINKRNMADVRNKVGLLFQDPDDQLFSPTVKEDIGFGPLNQGLSPEEVEKAVMEALVQVGMEGARNRSPHHMSFGEKKRIALATILSMKPAIFVMDEPITNLDPRGKREFMEHVSNLEATKLIVTHDLDMVAKICDRAIVMNCGKIVADGDIKMLLSDRELLLNNGLL